jgi:hypothetical protein
MRTRVILFLELGIQNVYLTIMMIYVVLLVASTAGMWLPDRFGRRPRELRVEHYLQASRS